MKILFLTHHSENLLGVHNYHVLEQAVAEFAECVYAGPGWPKYVVNEPMEETVKRVMPDAEWVVANRENGFKVPMQRSFRTCIFISDLHGKYNKQIFGAANFAKFLKDAEHDLVLSAYPEIHGTENPPDLFRQVLRDRFVWLPWCVSTDEYAPLRKTNDVCFIGAQALPTYPLRHHMFNRLPGLQRELGFSMVSRIGLDVRPYESDLRSMAAQGLMVGRNYAMALGSSRMFLCDNSVYRYPLQKNFEARSCGCCVLSDEPAGAGELGFVDGVDYVKVDLDNWREKFRWLLKHPDEVSRIGESARKLMVEKHSCRVRARELVEILRRR